MPIFRDDVHGAPVVMRAAGARVVEVVVVVVMRHGSAVTSRSYRMTLSLHLQRELGITKHRSSLSFLPRTLQMEVPLHWHVLSVQATVCVVGVVVRHGSALTCTPPSRIS